MGNVGEFLMIHEGGKRHFKRRGEHNKMAFDLPADAVCQHLNCFT